MERLISSAKIKDRKKVIESGISARRANLAEINEKIYIVKKQLGIGSTLESRRHPTYKEEIRTLLEKRRTLQYHHTKARSLEKAELANILSLQINQERR